jgi:signal transduction histidine kinase
MYYNNAPDGADQSKPQKNIVFKMSLAMRDPHLNPETKTAVKNGSKRCSVKLLFDQSTDVLTTRIQVLEKENNELIRLLKNEKRLNLKKAQSLSAASHDCRSPLTSIQLSASLIERYFDKMDRQKVFAHLEKIGLSIVELTGRLDELTEV